MVDDDASWAFIGSNSVRGAHGISTLEILGGGRARVVATHDAYNVGGLAVASTGPLLVAAHETMTFRGVASGACSAYSVDGDGRLRILDERPTAGQRSCRVAVSDDGAFVWTADFIGGTLTRLPLAATGLRPWDLALRDSEGRAGAAPMMHDVLPLPGGRHVGGMSVTTSSFVVFDVDTGDVAARHRFSDDSFVRSVIAAETGSTVYCMLQDPGEIHILDWSAPSAALTWIGAVHVLGEDFPGPWGTSALRLSPDGRALLAATRRTDTLSVFSVEDDGLLVLDSVVSLPGRTPRDFAFTPDGCFVVCAMQASDEVLVLPWDGTRLGDPVARLVIPSPAAVATSTRAAA